MFINKRREFNVEIDLDQSSCSSSSWWRSDAVFFARSMKRNGSIYTSNDKMIMINKKYVLSNSQSVQCNFLIFDHATFIQFKICCCVQNFMKIGWFFTEIWRYIDFQNGGRPPCWNCFTTIWDHPRSPCQISCQSNTQIWRYSCLNFSYIWLEMPKSASFKLSTVKIRWGVWPVGELTESVTDRHTHTHTHTHR